jgi:predicted phage-related endonuclease
MNRVRAIPDRATWLQWRANDLTASDVGAVAGVDPHRTPLRVYSEKAGIIEAEAESNLMRRGRWLEHAVIAALREELPGWDFVKANVYVDDPAVRLGCTPDVLTCDPDFPENLINVQLKVVSRPTFEREWGEGDGGVPMHYQLQTLTEGMLLDASASLIAALVIDTYSAELVVCNVPRHDAAEARVRALAQSFWSNIGSGVMPATDFARDGEVVKALYPASVPDKMLDMSGDNRLAEVLAQRAVAMALIKEHQSVVDALDVEIKDKLRDAELATLPGWKVSFKTELRKQYTVAASSRRVLRISEVAA